MQAHHLFNFGDIVKHKAANHTNYSKPRKLVIIGKGIIQTQIGNHTSNEPIYVVSGEKESMAPKDDLFFRVYLTEAEIELYPKETK